MTLSQDEINAMLAGLDSADSAPPAAEEAAASPEAPEPLNSLPREMMSDEDFDVNSPEWQLSEEEIDVLGEVGNICMGAVATTMYTLLDRRTEITTPRVSVHTTQQVLNEYTTPFVVVEVEYVEGIDGKNLLLLKEPDAAMITDLLMGGDGHVEEPIELSELHMSAISEIMNQMIGASATAMAKVLGMAVNISPPRSVWVDQKTDVSEYLNQSQVVVKVSFDMEIEGLLKSQLLQMIPFNQSRGLVRQVQSLGGIGTPHGAAAPAAAPEPAPMPAPQPQPQLQPQPQPQPEPQQAAPAYPPQGGGYPPPEAAYPQGYPAQPPAGYPAQPPAGYPAQPPAGYPAQPPAGYPYGYPAYSQPPMPQPGNLVDVRPMQYQSFDAKPAAPGYTPNGMDMIHDIPLTVTVELGRTKKDISEILEFGLGTVIVLDKVAGDPVEILVNGKLIARGEVVVIDENYGVRITDILST